MLQRFPQGVVLFPVSISFPMLTLTSFFAKRYTDSKEPTESETYHLEEKKGNPTQ